MEVPFGATLRLRFKGFPCRGHVAGRSELRRIFGVALRATGGYDWGMARAQRIEYEGAVYHVTARGNERRAIFHDDADREHFLRTLGESVGRFEVRLYLFCLMSNHIHLVVETPRANLGQFMHRLQTAYTIYFNRRHQRCGHLMQGRYKAGSSRKTPTSCD